MTKKYLDKAFTKITLPLPKTKTLWFACNNYNNISNIPKALKNDLKNKESINLLEGIYLLAAFKYFK